MENIQYALDFQRELGMDNQHQCKILPRFDQIVSVETRVKMVDLMANGHPLISDDVSKDPRA